MAQTQAETTSNQMEIKNVQVYANALLNGNENKSPINQMPTNVDVPLTPCVTTTTNSNNDSKYGESRSFWTPQVNASPNQLENKTEHEIIIKMDLEEDGVPNGYTRIRCNQFSVLARSTRLSGHHHPYNKKRNNECGKIRMFRTDE
jgi:hypothetical protein